MKRIIIIAEIGVNHNGDINLAKELIDVASDCGADIVKFQTYDAEELTIDNAPKALRKFLEDVGTPFGAKLSHLTPEIKEWLINENLLDQFVVKFK